MIQRNGNAPYAPAATVLELIERFRNHGLTVPFDLEVMQKAGVTESLAPRVLQALKLLDLVDESGQPTPNFIGLQEAPSTEYQETLAQVVRTAYRDVLAFTNPATDSLELVEDAFRGYRPLGQRARMVSLFMGLCQAAGIVEGPPRRSTSRTHRAPGSPSPVFRRVTPPQRSVRNPRRMSGITGLSTGLPPAIVALINDLPTRAQAWTEAERATFLAGFHATVEIYYPVVSEKDRRRQGELLPGPAQQD